MSFITRSTTIVAIALAVSACGSGVQGRYVGQGDTFFESMTFGSDGVVDVVFVGRAAPRRYQVEGERVTITAPDGDQAVLTIDSDGCFRNSIIGTYCKDGSGPAAAASGPAAGRPGGVYEARASEGRIALEFGAANKVRVTMHPSAGSDIPDNISFDVGYDTSGDEITINLPGDERLSLTRVGSDLQGTMNGETVRFVQR